MKRLALILGLLLLCLPALARASALESSWTLTAPTIAAQYFSPYYEASYRHGCGNLWRHERQEEARLREHQGRERARCGRWSTSGRCRNLGWHEQNEWQRLRMHQQTERARYGCR